MDLLYGRNPVLESLRAGRRHPRRLVLAAGSTEQGALAEIVRRARAAKLEIVQVPKKELGQRLGHSHHQGVLLETSRYPYRDLPTILEHARQTGEPPFLLLLDLLQDPQNVGTLLRTAEAVGVHGVVIQERRAVGITPAVVNASSGAVEHLRVAQVTNLPRAMATLQEENVWLYGLQGGGDAVPYQDANLAGGTALVVGAEGSGLRRLVAETCDVLIQLPMRGQVESLNAAVAGSVALYAVWRARGFS